MFYCLWTVVCYEWNFGSVKFELINHVLEEVVIFGPCEDVIVIVKASSIKDDQGNSQNLTPPSHISYKKDLIYGSVSFS